MPVHGEFKNPMSSANSHPATVNYSITPYSRALLEKLTGLQLVKKFPAFMEPEGSSPHSQVPDTCPYPKPAQSSPYLYIPLPEDPS